MLRRLFISALLAAGLIAPGGAAGAGEPAAGAKAAEKPPPTPSFVGPEACKACHPRAYGTWAGSKHSRSFVALGTAMARKVSGEPGAYAGMPSEKMTKECSPCHARGMEVPRKERGGLHPEDGVQCETCHGPGGHYAEEAVMKDPKRRTEAGLGKLGPEGCLRCHKQKDSHEVLGRVPFDFPKHWAKIEHGKKTADRKTASR